jgi:protein arginine kinase
MKALKDLTSSTPNWLLCDPGPGVACSSRVRLARNCAGLAFRRTLPNDGQQKLVDGLLPQLARWAGWQDALTIDYGDLNEIDRGILVERHLASPELGKDDSPAGLVIRADGMASVMVNEEDHLRIQVLAPGLDLQRCLDEAIALDSALEQEIGWAFNQQVGYLTSCPTNLGTGLRASVMLHLPGLADSKELPKALRGLNTLHMTARGMDGEGSDPHGQFYQVSNQRTLGKDETTIIRQLDDAVAQIVAHENLARHLLQESRMNQVQDRIWRAWGILAHARRLSGDEMIDQLSWLRLGIDLGAIATRSAGNLDRLLVTGRRWHIEDQSAAADSDERDAYRASMVRNLLTEICPELMPPTPT